MNHLYFDGLPLYRRDAKGTVGSYESPEGSVQGGRKGDILVAILRCS